MKIGVYLGRFQAPSWHEGHKAALSWIASQVDVVVVGVGVARALSQRNVLDFTLRVPATIQALQTVMRGEMGSMVIPILDQRDDRVWSRLLDEQLYQQFRGASVTLYYGRGSDLLTRYSGRNPVVAVPMEVCSPAAHICATDLRDTVYTPARAASEDFRAGVIHGARLFASRSVLAVDIGVVRWGEGSRLEVLLGRKYEDGELWRLPGGGVEHGETLERAARREVWEETAINLEQEPIYLGSHRVADWRFPADEQPITALFTAVHSWSTPTAGDDLDAVRWASLFELARELRMHTPSIPIVPEHQGLIADLERYWLTHLTTFPQPVRDNEF